jgi:hypothetical protein
MTAPDLPQLEKTLVDLALDLEQAAETHLDLIMPPSSSNTSAAREREAIRITMHFTMALLAYGFPPDYDPLENAADWFATPYQPGTRIDLDELTRLEALLHLKPTAELVRPRLEQLMRQRKQNGRWDIASQPTPFDTIWVLKVLTLAHKLNGDLPCLPKDELTRLIDSIMRTAHEWDKDLTLALGLRHELCGNLTQRQQTQYLTRLMREAEGNGGFLDLTDDLRPLAAALRNGTLSPGDVLPKREDFRKMIVNMLYMVENLSPLRGDFPDLEPLLGEAMRSWWMTFYEQPVERLSAMFTRPYDYLMVVSRTLIALAAYLDQPLIQLGAINLHRRTAKQNRAKLTNEKANIVESLRRWIEIEFDRAPEPMTLGLSGASVVRVYPIVRNPLQPDGERLNFAESLVVKYGPRTEIELERSNYMQVPQAILEYFVKIPNDTYFDETSGRSYVIMRDLYSFKTLDELCKEPRIYGPLQRDLPTFLMNIHRGGNRHLTIAPRGSISQIYLLPMQEHMSTLFGLLFAHEEILDGNAQDAAELQSRLMTLLSRLLPAQFELDRFPQACMHGDLHSRNIMLRFFRSQHTSYGESDLAIRLIDLEKFQRAGDAAMDIGNLLVDINVLLERPEMRGRRGDVPHPLTHLRDHLRAKYADFAHNERADTFFLARLELAQARSFVRIAKALTREIERHLKMKNRRQAADRVLMMLDYGKRAADHLKNMLEMLGL